MDYLANQIQLIAFIFWNADMRIDDHPKVEQYNYKGGTFEDFVSRVDWLVMEALYTQRLLLW